jgi:hypothetical protein
MTPTDHNKVLSILHLIYGGLNFFSLLIVIPFFLIGLPLGFGGEPEAQIVGAVFIGVALLVGFFALLFSLPPLIAAYGMHKHRPWARTAGIVAAVLAAISFPLGTALCVYSFWFYMGEGRGYYEGAGASPHWRGALGDAPASTYGWDAQRSAGAQAYTPPPQPPSWRD